MSNQPKIVGSVSPDPEREIKNVVLLDLTTLKSTDELSNITSIQNVATMLVPESLMGALMKIRIKMLQPRSQFRMSKRLRHEQSMGFCKWVGSRSTTLMVIRSKYLSSRVR